MFFCCLRQSCCFLAICKEGLVPLVRTTGSTCSCGSSGTTLGWPTRSTQTTPWTWTPPCWTPFGNLTCSSPTKRGQTSMRSRRTTNCCGYSRTETFSTASGDCVWRAEKKKKQSIIRADVRRLRHSRSTITNNFSSHVLRCEPSTVQHVCFTPVQFTCHCIVQHPLRASSC